MRLTERDEFGNADIIGVDSMDLQCNLEFDEFNKVTNALNKLAEYEDLEEQKQLLKLPCAVGDTVYHLCTLKSGETEMIEMKVGCVEPYGAIRNHKGVCEIWNVYAETDCTKAYFRFSDFNKTVFLTREEAETALEEFKRG